MGQDHNKTMLKGLHIVGCMGKDHNKTMLKGLNSVGNMSILAHVSYTV
jgi:hypothetical protein